MVAYLNLSIHPTLQLIFTETLYQLIRILYTAPLYCHVIYLHSFLLSLLAVTQMLKIIELQSLLLIKPLNFLFILKIILL